MAGQVHGAAPRRDLRSQDHHRRPGPGQGRRQRRGRGACGDKGFFFCGQADLFFFMGFCVCVCVCAYLHI